MTAALKIGVGIVGTGFAASAHADALRRLPEVELVAVAGSSGEKADAFGHRWRTARSHGSWEELLADDAVEAVHNCTPNDLHAEINAACLGSGKHLLSEKPLGLDSSETAALVRAAEDADVIAGVCFNYRHFPLVRELKARLDASEAGRPHLVRGAYLQDWLLHETDWNWRLEADRGGAARALADIGSHWLDLSSYLLGDDVVAVSAQLGRLHDERLRPAEPAETFAAGRGADTPVGIESEDFASVLLRYEGGCKGTFTVSQVTAGRKNRLTIEVDTRAASFSWDQEEPNALWIGHRDGANEELLRDPALLGRESASLAHFPGGHQEGWPDALANLFRDFYATIADSSHPPSFATFADADRTTRVVEAIVASAREERWKSVEVATPS
jgi:predicted dehydrogenase